MKIVYITNKPIYPLLDGGCVAMNQFVKCLLQAGYDVKHFAISTHKHPFIEEKYTPQLRAIIHPEAIHTDTRINPLSALAYLFKKGSYNIDRFKSNRFRNILKNYLTSHKVDIVLFESIYSAGHYELVQRFSSAKIIIRSHNVEYLVWERLAHNEPFFLRKLYLKKLAKDLKKVETTILQDCNGIASISSQDQDIFKSLGIKTPITTIPVAIEQNEGVCDYSNQTFYHLGAMNWLPNLESARLLVSTFFPEIRKQLPTAKLVLAGTFMPDEFQTDESKGIEVVGKIDHLQEFITNHGIMLLPLQSGSGVRIKLLEAMSFGAPIVTTEIGIEGIIGRNGHDFLIAKNDKEFIDLAIGLAKSQEERTYIGTNAKKTIEANYQTSVITKKIIEFFSTIS